MKTGDSVSSSVTLIYCDYGFQLGQIISKWKEVNVSGDVKNSKLQNSGDCQNIESAENTKKTFFFSSFG